MEDMWTNISKLTAYCRHMHSKLAMTYRHTPFFNSNMPGTVSFPENGHRTGDRIESEYSSDLKSCTTLLFIIFKVHVEKVPGPNGSLFKYNGSEYPSEHTFILFLIVEKNNLRWYVLDRKRNVNRL